MLQQNNCNKTTPLVKDGLLYKINTIQWSTTTFCQTNGAMESKEVQQKDGLANVERVFGQA